MTDDPGRGAADPTLIAVDRDVLVRASRPTVFSFFTDEERFASWFGAGSSIEPEVGGAVRITFPGGATALGEVTDLEPGHRISFTWGYPGDDSPLPPGASTVTIVLEDHPDGTLVSLTHEVPSDELRAAHVAGWRHHLSHLATLAADERRPQLQRTLTQWLRLWNAAPAERSELAARVLADDVEVVDALATLRGRQDVVGHVDNAHEHLPGVTWEQVGGLATTGDRATWSWRMRHADHGVVGTGRDVATVGLDGRLQQVTGFWDDDPDEVARRVHGLAPTATPEATGDDEHPRLEPHLWTRDLPAAARWYERVLGFCVDARSPADGEPTWLRMRRDTVAIMLAAPPADTPGGTQAYTAAVHDRLDHGGPIALYLRSDDVAADLRRAEQQGVEPIEPAWDPWWGGRQFTLEAPDGVWWTVRRD